MPPAPPRSRSSDQLPPVRRPDSSTGHSGRQRLGVPARILRMRPLISLAASTSSGTDWGTLLGGIGIGAIVGAAVTGIFTALNGKWQRDHDREMRGIDHGQEAMAQTVRQQHELAVKQFE